MLSYRLSIVLVSLSRHFSPVLATCYMPNGTAIDNVAFQPCNQVTDTISMCCGTNWTTGGVSPDVCLPNGLCMNTGGGLYWRESCTDPTWKSPYCLANLCTTPDHIDPGDAATGNVVVSQCADGSWCCHGPSDNATQCCQQKQGVVLAATIGVSTSTSTADWSPTMPASSTSPATSMPSDGLSSPAQIGLGIGLTLGLILAAVAIIWAVRRRRQIRRMPKGPYATPTREPELYVASPGVKEQYELVNGGMARGRWELQ
jgi:hypothetical protein